MLILLLVAIVALVVWSSSRRSRSTPAPTLRRPGRRSLDEDLARWVDAELLTAEQASAIRAHESTTGAAIAISPRRRLPAVAEALGYLGGALATLGLLLVVGQWWSDVGVGGRLALSGAGALALLGAGVAVHGDRDAALARLQSVVWLASTAAAGLFAGVIAVEVLGTDHPTSVALACAVLTGAESAALWWRSDRPVQHATALAAVVVAAGTLVGESGSAGAAGLVVLGVGATLVAIGLDRRGTRPQQTTCAGALAAPIGAGIVAAEWTALGLLLAIAVVVVLVAASDLIELPLDPAERTAARVIGVLAALQAVPSTLGYFAGDAGVATGLLTCAAGAAVLLLSQRTRLLHPVAIEVAGALALIGGGALTGVQASGFAPLLGLAIAVTLVVVGASPGQARLAAYGALALLVNVPWTIGRWFPGRSRAPLLVLASGAVIIAIAVFLGRVGERIRTEGGPRAAAG